MNVTSQALPYYTYAFNVLRQNFLDPNVPIEGKENGKAELILDNILQNIYNLN